MLSGTLILVMIGIAGGLSLLTFLAKLNGRRALVLGAIVAFFGVPMGLWIHSMARGNLMFPWDGWGITLGMALALTWFFFQVLREALA